jgi:hypothetical protein
MVKKITGFTLYKGAGFRTTRQRTEFAEHLVLSGDTVVIHGDFGGYKMAIGRYKLVDGKNTLVAEQ